MGSLSPTVKLRAKPYQPSVLYEDLGSSSGAEIEV